MNTGIVGTIPEDKRIRSYLLNELSEDEQKAFEERYFDDYGVFERVKALESELLEEYARQQLAGNQQNWFAAFENHYSATPERQEKVAFAKELVLLSQEFLDGQVGSLEPDKIQELLSPVVERIPSWKSLFGRSRTDAQTTDDPPSRFGFFPLLATAAALLFLTLGGFLFIQNQRLQSQLNDIQAKRTELEQRERQLQQQLSEQSGKSETMGAELEKVRQELAQLKTVAPKPEPSKQSEEEPLLAMLTLEVNDRSTRFGEPKATNPLVIPRQAKNVQIQVAVDAAEYQSYQVKIQAVTRGDVIFDQSRLKPKGNELTLTLPASKFMARDYFLIIVGTKPTGNTEEVNKYALEVQKK